MSDHLNYNNLMYIKDRAGFCGLKAVEWYANMIGAASGATEKEIVQALLQDLISAYGRDIVDEVLSNEAEA